MKWDRSSPTPQPYHSHLPSMRAIPALWPIGRLGLYADESTASFVVLDAAMVSEPRFDTSPTAR